MKACLLRQAQARGLRLCARVRVRVKVGHIGKGKGSPSSPASGAPSPNPPAKGATGKGEQGIKASKQKAVHLRRQSRWQKSSCWLLGSRVANHQPER